MKNEKMLRAIGGIDDDMIEDAVIQPSQKKQPFLRTPAFRRAVAIAACFVLIIGLAFSVPTWLNPNHEGPGVPVEPGTLLPPSVQGDGEGIQINGLDQLNYYAAVRMIEGTPRLANQSMIGGSYGITLLASGSDTDKREEPPVPETTGPDENQPTPVTPDPSRPPVIGEDIYYYALDPNEPFYINKVSMFQIELTDENGFLASQLGLGIVDVVITEECIWGDSLITFRNGDKFYSCLSNGWGYNRETDGVQWDFSTHKYVEGFFIVKNIAQENYGFYIDVDAQGQAIAFSCGETENGGNRADKNVKVISSTVISNMGCNYTVAELEDYFNTGKLPEGMTQPVRPNTNLEFWIAENVDSVDFSNLQEKYGLFGGREYYGTGYVPTIDENGQQVDPEHCVIYTVTSYPDYSDKEQHITGIYITDPNVEFYGITLSCTFEEFMELIQQQGFAIIESNENAVSARCGKVWITFTTEWIRIGVEVTNDQGIVF